MPGIIVSRPIFNTLFKLAHEEGLSINAFLTRLLEKAGPESGPSSPQAPASSTAAGVSADPGPDIVGSERGDFEQPAAATPAHQPPPFIKDEREPAGAAASYDNGDSGVRTPGRRIGNSVWDKVVSMEGHRFSTSRGKKFTYKVTGEYIVVRDSHARIPRSQFDKAQKMWPVSGPSRLVGVYAPSVVWAVMKEANAESEEAVLA